MGLLTRVLEPVASTPAPDHDFWYNPAPIRSASGAVVTQESALGISAFWDCVKVISEDVAKLPLITYERTPDGKRPAPEYFLYRTLHSKPNGWMTSFQWRRWLVRCRLQWGNGLSEIVLADGGIHLIPIHPSRCRAELQKNGRVMYFVKEDGTTQERPVEQERMFHLMGESNDGVWGMSVVTVARNSLGLALAAEQHGAQTFKSGISKRVALTHPGHLGEETAKRLGKDFDATYAGNLNTVVLEEGMGVTDVGMSNDDAQFLETRQFQVEEIARWFRMKPHKIGDLSHATFSNIEHESIDYVIDTLLPELVNFEQSTQRLIPDKDEARIFAEFRVEGLLRGDSKSRAEALQIWRQNGVINSDEWRGIENMNAIPGGLGKIYLQMANLVPLGTLPSKATTSEKALAVGEQTKSANHTVLAEELAGRVLKKQRDRIQKAAAKNTGDDAWRAWLSEFFNEQAAEISQGMHITIEAAQEFCNEQRFALLHHGVGAMETMESEWSSRLARLALEGE